MGELRIRAGFCCCSGEWNSNDFICWWELCSKEQKVMLHKDGKIARVLASLNRWEGTNGCTGFREEHSNKKEGGAWGYWFCRLVDVVVENQTVKIPVITWIFWQKFGYLLRVRIKEEVLEVWTRDGREESVRKPWDNGLGKYMNSGNIKSPLEVHETWHHGCVAFFNHISPIMREQLDLIWIVVCQVNTLKWERG